MPGGRPPCKLRQFFDKKKTMIVKSMTQCPCIWCGIYVSMVARSLKNHFLLFCRKIPNDCVEKITAIIAEMEESATTKSIKAPSSKSSTPQSSNQLLLTPATNLSKSVSKINIKTPSNPSKKRKLNDGHAQSHNLLNHFTRSINDQNFDKAIELILEWALRLEIVSIEEIIDKNLRKVFKFLCSSFDDKFSKCVLLDRVKILKKKMNADLYKSLSCDCYGFIGIRLQNDVVEVWALSNKGPLYLKDIEKDIFSAEEVKFDEDSDLDNNDILSTINKLKNINYKIIGIKYDVNILNCSELLKEIQQISVQENIIIIRKIDTKLDMLIDEILKLDVIKERIDKMNVIIDFLLEHIQLKQELEIKMKQILPDNILDRIEFMNKCKPFLIELAAKFVQSLRQSNIQNSAEYNDKIKLVKQYIFTDDLFWIGINDLAEMTAELVIYRGVVNGQSQNVSMGFLWFKWLLLCQYYKNSSFVLWNQYQVKNDKVKSKLVKALYGLLPSNVVTANALSSYTTSTNLTPAAASIYINESAAYTLSALLNANFACRAGLKQIEESNTFMKMMVPIAEYRKFNDFYIELRRKKGYFSPLKWIEKNGGWGGLAGSDYQEFALFGEMMTTASGLSIDTTLANYSNVNCIDKFCRYNLQSKFN